MQNFLILVALIFAMAAVFLSALSFDDENQGGVGAALAYFSCLCGLLSYAAAHYASQLS